MISQTLGVERSHSNWGRLSAEWNLGGRKCEHVTVAPSCSEAKGEKRNGATNAVMGWKGHVYGVARRWSCSVLYPIHQLDLAPVVKPIERSDGDEVGLSLAFTLWYLVWQLRLAGLKPARLFYGTNNTHTYSVIVGFSFIARLV